jgi:hypothetical protein
MAEQPLIEIFNDCLERLAQGLSPDECLALYPAYAHELRPLLETAQIARQMPFPLHEQQEDQEAVWARLEEVLALPMPRIQPAPRRQRWFPKTLAAGLLIGLVSVTMALGYIFVIRPTLEPTPTSTPTATSTAAPTNTPTATATLTHTPSATLTPTATATLTSTPSARSTATASATIALPATNTLAPSRTPVPSVTPSATVCSRVVMQGVITAIDENTLTLYDFTLEVDPDEPLLARLRVGMVVRVEGCIIGSTMTVEQISIAIATATATASRGVAPTAPPTQPPAAPPSGGDGGSGASPSGNDDDDGDDNDDDDNSSDD